MSDARRLQAPGLEQFAHELAHGLLVVHHQHVALERDPLRALLRELLDTWGLQATSVTRPEAALELVRAAPDRFDVVITDQSMPRLTGLELAGRLRTIRPDLPVILYTGYGDGVPDHALDAARLTAVIRKPVDPVLLSGALAGCLAQRVAS